MKQLFGKQNTLEYFKLAANGGALSHLYIISAPVGQGKSTFVSHIAAMLHCENKNAPCGVCGACIKHRSGNHPDVFRIESEKVGSPIGVAAARSIAEDIYVKPLISDRKIYIISATYGLTTETQNALLKILEEPPSYATIFLLVPSADMLLQTVLSRGIVLTLPCNTFSEVYSFIKSEYPDRDDAVAQLIANFASGNIGVAQAMCENGDFLQNRKLLYNALSDFSEGKRSVIYSVLNVFEKNKNEINTLLELLNIWLRDVLYIKTVRNADGILNTDYKDEILSFASHTRADGVLKAAEHIADTVSAIGKGSNISLWITDLLIKCWEDLHG